MIKKVQTQVLFQTDEWTQCEQQNIILGSNLYTESNQDYQHHQPTLPFENWL